MIKVSPRTKKTSFVVEMPEAENVVLVGDFNSWDASATPMKYSKKTGVWKADLELSTGEYEFRYLVNDQEWINDSEVPAVPNEFGTSNSILQVELPKAQAKKAAARKSPKKN